MYGIAQSSAKPTYLLKCLRYSTSFVPRDPPVSFSTFPMVFPVFHMTRCRGFSFSKVFILRCAIALIMHQKRPLFSDLDSLFASLCHCVVSMGQRSAHFDRGSSLFCASCNCHCLEVLPDSPLFTIFWSLT